MRKVGIFSGGGTLGAYTVGLLSEMKPKYDLTIGTSTGALIACLSACDKYDELKEAYSSLNNEDIFDYNLFNKRKKIKKWYIIYRFLTNKLSISNIGVKLEKLVRKYFTEEDFNLLNEKDREVRVTALRMDIYPSSVKYFSSKKMEYDEFVKAVVASASVPVLSLPVKIGDGLYADGGVTEPIPTRTDLGLVENDRVDLFLHNPVEEQIENKKGRNLPTIILNIIRLMHYEIRMNDLKVLTTRKTNLNLKDTVVVKDRVDDVDVTSYFLPYKLSSNVFYFDREQMREWIELGKTEYSKIILSIW